MININSCPRAHFLGLRQYVSLYCSSAIVVRLSHLFSPPNSFTYSVPLPPCQCRNWLSIISWFSTLFFAMEDEARYRSVRHRVVSTYTFSRTFIPLSSTSTRLLKELVLLSFRHPEQSPSAEYTPLRLRRRYVPTAVLLFGGSHLRAPQW